MVEQAGVANEEAAVAEEAAAAKNAAIAFCCSCFSSSHSPSNVPKWHAMAKALHIPHGERSWPPQPDI
jgi:hypothetical protein